MAAWFLNEQKRQITINTIIYLKHLIRTTLSLQYFHIIPWDFRLSTRTLSKKHDKTIGNNSPRRKDAKNTASTISPFHCCDKQPARRYFFLQKLLKRKQQFVKFLDRNELNLHKFLILLCSDTATLSTCHRNPKFVSILPPAITIDSSVKKRIFCYGKILWHLKLNEKFIYSFYCFLFKIIQTKKIYKFQFKISHQSFLTFYTFLYIFRDFTLHIKMLCEKDTVRFLSQRTCFFKNKI